MTLETPTLPGLRFVRERSCPYLPGQTERTLAAPLPPLRAAEVLDAACRAGFRRNQNYVYRPACRGCAACVPVRVIAADFTWGKSWRRICKVNSDLVGNVRPARVTEESFDLFHRYQLHRHGADGMGAMTYSDFRAMVEDSPAPASLIEHRDANGTLIAALLADHVTDGWSAVYSFFAPEASHRSLGSYMILDLVQRTVAEQRPFVYLGYWVSGSQKMAYKARFSPLQVLDADGWRTIAPPPATPIIPVNRIAHAY